MLLVCALHIFCSKTFYINTKLTVETLKMKKHIIFLAISFASFFAVVAPAHAQIPVTDLASQVSQGRAYAQQLLQYTQQGLQLQADLKNLMNNPASLLGAEVGGLINGVGSIMSAGNSIGGNMAQISKNFSTMYKTPSNETLTRSFTRWHSTNTDTLEGALKAAGVHREAFKSDADALTAMYNKSQAAGGNLQALQSLAEINATQVQQIQKLQDLIATQNIAASNYMAVQTAKAEAKNQQEMMYTSDYDKSIPEIQIGAPKRWSEIYKK